MAGTIQAPSVIGAPPPPHPAGAQARVLLCGVVSDDPRHDRDRDDAPSPPLPAAPLTLDRRHLYRDLGVFAPPPRPGRAWELAMIQHNITAHCTLLDLAPTNRFIEQIAGDRYDVIAIHATAAHAAAVMRMCESIRHHQPQAMIVLTGPIAADTPPTPAAGDGAPALPADHLVGANPIAWFRQLLGEAADRPIHHPRLLFDLGQHVAALDWHFGPGEPAAVLIPHLLPTPVPESTSGNEPGDEAQADGLFQAMVELEGDLKVQAFLIVDEGLLFDRGRVMRLLARMQQHDKAWSLNLLTTTAALRGYSMDELIALGVASVWVPLGAGGGGNGMAGEGSLVDDDLALVRELQAHGICVFATTVLSGGDCAPERIDAAIRHAVRHDAEVHHFLFDPGLPGAPMGGEADGEADPQPETEAAPTGSAEGPMIAGPVDELLRRALQRDFEINGPSIVRLIRTTLRGYLRHGQHTDGRIRRRLGRSIRRMAARGSATVWACRAWFEHHTHLWLRIDTVLQQLYAVFSLLSRLIAPLSGRRLYHRLRREHNRLTTGWRDQPPIICQSTAGTEAPLPPTGPPPPTVAPIAPTGPASTDPAALV